MTEQRIIDQIRKLLALSKSDNPNEAAAALAKAEKKMQEHQLSQADLGELPADEGILSEDIEAFGPRQVTWRTMLCNELAAMHGCCALLQIGAFNREKHLAVVGAATDIAIVRTLYAWTAAEIDRLADIHGAGAGAQWRNSYRHGCVEGIIDAMKDARARARERASSTALAVVDERLRKSNEYADKELGAEPNNNRITVRRDAYDRGHADGWEIHERSEAHKGRVLPRKN